MGRSGDARARSPPPPASARAARPGGRAGRAPVPWRPRRLSPPQPRRRCCATSRNATTRADAPPVPVERMASVAARPLRRRGGRHPRPAGRPRRPGTPLGDARLRGDGRLGRSRARRAAAPAAAGSRSPTRSAIYSCTSPSPARPSTTGPPTSGRSKRSRPAELPELRRREREANVFARELLMPETLVERAGPRHRLQPAGAGESLRGLGPGDAPAPAAAEAATTHGVKIVHLSDTHLGLRELHHTDAEGRNVREQDVYDVFARAIDKALELKPAAVVHSGDLFHGHHPAAAALGVALDQIERLRAAGIEFVVIAGNHSTPRSPGDRAPVLAAGALRRRRGPRSSRAGSASASSASPLSPTATTTRRWRLDRGRRPRPGGPVQRPRRPRRPGEGSRGSERASRGRRSCRGRSSSRSRASTTSPSATSTSSTGRGSTPSTPARRNG